MDKKALFYFNDIKCRDVCKFSFLNRGFYVEVVDTFENTLLKLKKEKYDWCLVDDSNRETLSNLDLDTVSTLYKGAKENIKNKDIKFLVLSYFQEVINKANKLGLPAMEKREFDGNLDNIVGKKV